jgi:hypothetical protein
MTRISQSYVLPRRLSPLGPKAKVTLLITLRLHEPYQGSLANNNSRKHLIFFIPGILTRFEGGVTQVSTFEASPMSRQ